MAKAKAGSEGKSVEKKSSPSKGGTKSEKAAKPPAKEQAVKTSRASKPAAAEKAKAAPAKASTPAKRAETKQAAPAAKEPAAVPSATQGAEPEARKAGIPAKPAQETVGEKIAVERKPAEKAAPTEPEKAITMAPAKVEQVKEPVPPEPPKKPIEHITAPERSAPVQAQPVSKPAAPPAAPAEKTPQWPDVDTDSLDGIHLPVARGKVTVFGGPKDRGGKRDDKLGLPTGPHYQYELVRNLNPKSFYCSMRWEYRQGHMSAEEGKRWWANKRILVSANGRSVAVKAVDYGPHENTGFSIGISPAAAEALGIEPGHEVEVKFADQKTPLGPVSE